MKKIGKAKAKWIFENSDLIDTFRPESPLSRGYHTKIHLCDFNGDIVYIYEVKGKIDSGLTTDMVRK